MLDEAAFAAGGFGLLLGLAALLYLAHPWWIVRRRRLKSLSARGPSPLLEDLEQLRREIGLSRSPDWRLAPFARTTGGQAFGLPWQRYVQIDAGLAILRVTDRPGFRAVVLHELAHLRNRDVDKTYLTVSIWRAFALVVLLPYLISILHPGLLLAPLDWRWQDIAFIASPANGAYRIGSLLVLVGFVYLTRNAILRVRETHADATAAEHDGTNSALQAVLGRLPATPWWRRWGTHPHPRQRIDTVRDPRLLLAAGFWELAGAGMATGLVCSKIGLLVGIYFTIDPILALAVAGIIACSPAIALLAIAIWRTAARNPAASPPLRAWLGYPAAMVAGFAAGTFPTLQNASTAGGGGTSVSAASFTISTLLLLSGAVFLAAWLASVTRAVLAQPDRPLWTMPAVVAVAIFVGAVWFAVWWPASLIEAGFADGWGAPPAAGAEIGWYASVAAVTGAGFGPMGRLVFNPLTLLGLTLMWRSPSRET
jgi:Zn-dependent protease with chaperone function